MLDQFSWKLNHVSEIKANKGEINIGLHKEILGKCKGGNPCSMENQLYLKHVCLMSKKVTLVCKICEQLKNKIDHNNFLYLERINLFAS